MLKKFFMNALSSFVGAWIALVLFGVVVVLVCIGIFAKLGVSSSSADSISKECDDNRVEWSDRGAGIPYGSGLHLFVEEGCVASADPFIVGDGN